MRRSRLPPRSSRKSVRRLYSVGPPWLSRLKRAQQIDVIQPRADHRIGPQFRRDDPRVGDAEVVAFRQQVEVVVHRLLHRLLDGHLIRRRSPPVGRPDLRPQARTDNTVRIDT